MSQSLPSRRSRPPRKEKSLAEVAELADAHGSGPCTRKGVGVRVPSSAPLINSQCRFLSRGKVSRATSFSNSGACPQRLKPALQTVSRAPEVCPLQATSTRIATPCSVPNHLHEDVSNSSCRTMCRSLGLWVSLLLTDRPVSFETPPTSPT